MATAAAARLTADGMDSVLRNVKTVVTGETFFSAPLRATAEAVADLAGECPRRIGLARLPE